VCVCVGGNSETPPRPPPPPPPILEYVVICFNASEGRLWHKTPDE